MSCVCVYSEGADYGPEFCVEKIRTARKKPNVCCECRSPIALGESYEHVLGKWESGFNSYITCLPCVEIRRNFMCEGFTYTDLWRDITGQVFRERGIDAGCFDSLVTALAKEKLASQYRVFLGVQS